MLAESEHIYRRFLVRLVDHCRYYAAWVVGGASLLTAVLIYYTATHLVLDTNTMNMLDKDLTFRQVKLDFEGAFPQLDDVLVIVIDAKTGGRAREVADAFSETLRQEPTLFRSLYRPGHGPFFSRYGLLYLDTEELWDVDKRLTEAEPFLGTVSRDPSLRGLFSGLGKAFDQDISSHHQTLLTKIFNGISETIIAQFSGHPSHNVWHDDFLEVEQTLGNEHRSFILIQPHQDFQSLQSGGDAIERIRHLARKVEREEQGGIRIRLTGAVVMADEELESVSSGAGLATLLSFVLLWILLYLGFRSARLINSILITLFIGLIWTTAFATLTVGHLNLLSVTFPVLFIGLGVDFGIQFGMRYREEIDRGSVHAVALSRAAGGVGGALTLAAAAAAISFFSFLPTSYQGFRELGLIAGGGMVIALFVNISLLPALLSLIPIHRANRRTSRVGLFFGVNVIAVAHRRQILALTALVIGGALTILPKAQFDFNPVNLKDPTTESVATFQDLLRDPKSTPYTISVLADDLVSAQAIASELEKLDEVDKTITLASFVPKNQDEKLAIIEDMNLVLQPVAIPVSYLPPPETEEQVHAINVFSEKLKQWDEKERSATFTASLKQLAGLLEEMQEAPGWPDQFLKEYEKRMLGDFSKNLDKLQNLLTASEVTIGDLPQDLRERYLASDGRTRVQVFPADDLTDNEMLRKFVRSVQTIEPNATDTPVSILEGGDTVVRACLQATAITLIASLVLLLMVLSNLRDTILVLIPLLSAVALTIASSVLLSVPLNLANIIALPLLLGLGMAFGIYLILRHRSGVDTKTLFESSTPRAVLFSALTTIGSFGTLGFSNHIGISSIGIILTLSLFFALLCTLVVLPSILAELELRKRRTLS